MTSYDPAQILDILTDETRPATERLADIARALTPIRQGQPLKVSALVHEPNRPGPADTVLPDSRGYVRVLITVGSYQTHTFVPAPHVIDAILDYTDEEETR